MFCWLQGLFYSTCKQNSSSMHQTKIELQLYTKNKLILLFFILILYLIFGLNFFVLFNNNFLFIYFIISFNNYLSIVLIICIFIYLF